MSKKHMTYRSLTVLKIKDSESYAICKPAFGGSLECIKVCSCFEEMSDELEILFGESEPDKHE